MSNGSNGMVGTFPIWSPGDIGVTTGEGAISRLIQTGQRIHGDAFWKWNHAFIVVDWEGNTVEALGRGVVCSNVSEHGKQMNIGCPPGVDRDKVIEFALSKIGDKYSYTGDVYMGIDCLLHTKFHTHSKHSEFCSELAAEALKAGGWQPPTIPALTRPSTLVAEAQGSHLLLK